MKHPRTLALIAAALVLYILVSAGAAGVRLTPSVAALSAVALWSALLPFWRRHEPGEPVPGLVAWMGSLVGLALGAWLSLEVRALLGELIVAAALPPLGIVTLQIALTAPDTPPRLVRHLYVVQPARLLALGALVLGLAAALPPVWLFGRAVIAPHWFASAPPAFFVACAVPATGVRALRRQLGSNTRALAANLWPLLGSCLALCTGLVLVILQAGALVGPELVTGGVTAAAFVFVLGHLWLVTEARALVAGAWSRELFATSAAAVIALSVFALAAVRGGDDPVTRVGLCALSVCAFLLARQSMRRLARTLFAPQRGALLDAVTRIREDIPGATSYPDLAARMLRPLRRASDSPEAAPVLYSFAPTNEVRLDAAGLPRVSERGLAAVVVRSLREAGGDPIVREDLRARLVRRPELRELLVALDELDALCVVPMLTHGEIEGALVVACGARMDPLTLEELRALEQLANFAAPLAAQFLAGERAQRRADEASQQRDELNERLDEARDELAKLRAEANLLKAGQGPGSTALGSVHYSPAMRELTEQLSAIAAQDVPVLLVTEHGVPVVPLADLLLRAGGRRGAPLVVGECASVPPEEQAAALFGARTAGPDGQSDYRPGWLQLAADGVLLLTDLAALSLDVQRGLVDALSDKRARVIGGTGAYAVTARLVASVRAPLDGAVALGAVLPELAHWLEKATYHVPALRERKEDVESLALLAVDRAARVLGREVPGIAPEAMQRLLDYGFPGNLPELESVMERAVAAARGSRIAIEDLPPLPEGSARAGSFLDQEREILRRALERAGGNKTRAARALGLKRTTLIDKLRRLGLEPPAGTREAEH